MIKTHANASADTAQLIEDLRVQIDNLDIAIIRLVAERAQVSRQIQEARVKAGGTRTELHRESAILQHYRQHLGLPGVGLGETVLRICRGA